VVLLLHSIATATSFKSTAGWPQRTSADMNNTLAVNVGGLAVAAKNNWPFPLVDCGYHANHSVGWTGLETVSQADSWTDCCDACKEKFHDSPPCRAWVFLPDGKCYQKYYTTAVRIDSSSLLIANQASEAGILDDYLKVMANASTTSTVTTTTIAPSGTIGFFVRFQYDAGETFPTDVSPSEHIASSSYLSAKATGLAVALNVPVDNVTIMGVTVNQRRAVSSGGHTFVTTDVEVEVADEDAASNMATTISQAADAISSNTDSSVTIVGPPEVLVIEITTTTTTSAPSEAHALGDPHVSNMRGEHFDIYRPGTLPLLHVPRHANRENRLLFVQADARQMRNECDAYFQTVTVSGIWTNQSGPIRFIANPHGTPPGIKWKEWVRFGDVQIQVVHRMKDINYLDFYAKVDAQSEYEVGGLLGSDDHTFVSTRPHECSHRRKAVLSSSASASTHHLHQG